MTPLDRPEHDSRELLAPLFGGEDCRVRHAVALEFGGRKSGGTAPLVQGGFRLAFVHGIGGHVRAFLHETRGVSAKRTLK